MALKRFTRQTFSNFRINSTGVPNPFLTPSTIEYLIVAGGGSGQVVKPYVVTAFQGIAAYLNGPQPPATPVAGLKAHFASTLGAVQVAMSVEPAGAA